MATSLKISKELYDAKNCNDKDLVINSDLPSLKVYSHGEFSATLPANEQYVNVVIATHNLGYKPMFLVFCEIAKYVEPNCNVVSGERHPFSSANGCVYFVSWSTSTQIIIQLKTMTVGMVATYDRTFHGHYYIFHNPI